jgi:hypothetical protein
VYTTGDRAHIDIIFKFLHQRINMGALIFFTAAIIVALEIYRAFIA